MYRNFKVATKSRNYQSPSGDGSYIDCIGIFILFMRITGWHGLFPSWEGLGVGSLVVKSQRIFHELPPYPPLNPFPRGDFLTCNAFVKRSSRDLALTTYFC